MSQGSEAQHLKHDIFEAAVHIFSDSPSVPQLIFDLNESSGT